MTRFAPALIAGLLFAPPLPAADPAPEKPGQGPFVVLVGVEAFDDAAIQPRPTAAKDAAALYDVLTDAKYLGVPKDRAVLLTAKPDEARGGQKATRENIIKAVKDAVAKTGKDDLVVLGFFGRGAPSGDATAIFATDSTVKDRGKTAVLGSDLGTELKAAKSRKIAFLMDLNFRGFDAGKEILAEPTLRDVLGAVFGMGEDREESGTIHDKLVMLSAIPINDPILTKGENGLFAATVAEALKGAADTDGYEPDGLITVDELVKYVEKTATEEARKLGKTAKEKEAVPFVAGEEVSHFVVTKNPAVTPVVTEREAAVAALLTDGKLTKDIAEEGAALIKRMPKLKLQQDLRKQYQSLADGKLTPEKFGEERTKIKASMKLPPELADQFARKIRIGVEVLAAKYVKVLNEGDLSAAAARGIYKRLEEPFPTDLEEKLKTPKTMTPQEQRDILREARDRLGKREDLDDDKDVDIGMLMMGMSLNDPYTVYLDKETMKKSESQIRSQFSGVGIHIRRDLARDGLLVVSPIRNSPAYKAGVKPGDLIVEVRRDVDPLGKPFTSEADKVISTRGMKTESALDIILGKPGVPVTLVLEREGETKPLSFTIERGRVSLETVLGVTRKDDDSWNYWYDEEARIGYVYLTQFGPNTYAELKKTVEQLNRTGMKGLVLDLRMNPGGLLNAALYISDLFIEDGLLLRVKPRVGQEEKYYDQGFLGLVDFPMAVLINGQSASASEIVSACLQDRNRAIVVGERSYGKGSVQTVEKFDPTGGEFKMTTARYFPPLGRNIDRLSTGGKPDDEWGVVPDKDFEIKMTREERQDLAELLRDKELIPNRNPTTKKPAKTFDDKQLKAAVEYLKKKADGKAAKK